jgi:MoxR-like ATPase
MMEFARKYFNPTVADEVVSHDGGVVSVGSGTAPGDVYVYTPSTVLALNVALATSRPLLVTGEPGSGKTTLAQNAANVLGWWYYRETVTSRLQASDLFYRFDALRRLNDASTPGVALQSAEHYVTPGVLWWAFDPSSAPHRGARNLPLQRQAANPGIAPAPTAAGERSPNAVVLLDEIDKADPDVPNDLLEAFESRRFTIRETEPEAVVQSAGDRRVLLVLTSNGERELPPAFLRRCVTLALDPPSASFFATVADRRFGRDDPRHLAIADEVMKAREEARRRGVRLPSTAEFLDAVQVCRELEVETASKAWKSITGSVLLKSDRG